VLVCSLYALASLLMAEEHPWECHSTAVTGGRAPCLKGSEFSTGHSIIECTHTSTPWRHDGVEPVRPQVHVRALCVSLSAHTAADQ
jgi:hypothetical protein